MTTLQAGYRGYRTRKALKESRKLAEASSKTNDDNESPITVGSEVPSADEIAAVTKLQAGFRGYQTRKNLKQQQRLSPHHTDKEDVAPAESNDTSFEALVKPSEEQIAAAVKLQAGFRGFQTRRNLKAEKEGGKPASDQGETSSRTGMLRTYI